MTSATSIHTLTASAARFEFFGAPHVTAIALTIILAVGLPILAHRGGSSRRTRRICWALVAILLVNELIFYVYGLFTVDLHSFAQTKLPLHLCGLSIYLSAYVLITRNQFAYELAYFWGLGGTLQAIITPDLTNGGFPSYAFMTFFVTHCGIVVAVAFATWGLRLRPRRSAILWTFLVSNVLLVVVGGANWLLDANYMFLCEKPEGTQVFFFLDWPWYLLFLEPVGLAIFALLYLPFPLTDRLRTLRHQKPDPAA